MPDVVLEVGAAVDHRGFFLGDALDDPIGRRLPTVAVEGRVPSISKYCTSGAVAPTVSSNVARKLAVDRLLRDAVDGRGDCTPQRSSSVGAMSTTWQNCSRTSLARSMPWASARSTARGRRRATRTASTGGTACYPPTPIPRRSGCRAEAAPLVHAARLSSDRRAERERTFVHRTERATFGARTIVGEQHEHGVVEQVAFFEGRDQAPDLVVGVAEEACEDLLHAAA